MTKDKWIWMPHVGHFICGHDCRFFLNTCVGDFIVSTVGDYLPDSAVRDLLAESRGKPLEGKGDARLHDWLKKFGYEEIGCDRKYETMVFKAVPGELKCCPMRLESGAELDFQGYNDPGEARDGHLAMCEKWAGKTLADVLAGELDD